MKTPSVEKPRAVTTVSVKLDATERDRIAVLAGIKKRSPHYLMKEAILDYVGREEAHQRFIAAAQASFLHYKETGLHVGFDEFSAWVDAVQQAPNTPMPPCHS
ncbi:trifunctional transcriptional regulator/proline dehydrogenase/pyrroline-5-carboxylate dehydrogenase [mine drainage metagenome]|uniref:Trifunctional transcriptional regulator/proline dehydrogenase/pyrroline-5-carboxylate dehydrogenase n=1 Tax=mine drainage metagenome TaxID=410659 RepID=A0A1J5PCU9_9ZZZZ